MKQRTRAFQRTLALLIAAACLLPAAHAVEDPEGVDWNVGGNAAFVTSAYDAIYGSVPPDAVVAQQAARLNNRADRYRFVKWLLVQPEYKAAFGSPRGEFRVYYNSDRTRYAVAKERPPNWLGPVEEKKAFGPAFVLKTYYDSLREPFPQGGVAAPGGAASDPASGNPAPAPSGNGAVTVEGLQGHTYDVYMRGKKAHQVTFTSKLYTPERPERGYRTKVARVGGSLYELGHYRMENGRLRLDQVFGAHDVFGVPKGTLPEFTLSGTATGLTADLTRHWSDKVTLRFVRR